MCFIFSDFTLEKKPNFPDSPSKGKPEKCNLGIVFQKEMEISG